MKLAAATLIGALGIAVHPVGAECGCGSPVDVEWQGTGTVTVAGITADASVVRTMYSDNTYTETFISTGTSAIASTICTGTRSGTSESLPTVSDDCSIMFPSYTTTSCAVECSTNGVSLPLDCDQYFTEEPAFDAVFTDDCLCLDYDGLDLVFGTVCRGGDGTQPPTSQNGTPAPTATGTSQNWSSTPTATPTTPSNDSDDQPTQQPVATSSPTILGPASLSPSVPGGGDREEQGPTDPPTSSCSYWHDVWSLMLTGVFMVMLTHH